MILTQLGALTEAPSEVSRSDTSLRTVYEYILRVRVSLVQPFEDEHMQVLRRVQRCSVKGE